jgi:hypothetical protein
MEDIRKHALALINSRTIEERKDIYNKVGLYLPKNGNDPRFYLGAEDF